MKKKRKNKSMYLVLMLLLLASAGFATYAIYKTSARGTANVTAANWVVKVTANNTTTNVTGGANNINLGSCANRLAPGGSCTIPFTVDMTESEVDSILTVGIGSGINQDTLSLMNEAGLSLKISDGTNEGYAYALNYGTTKVLNLVIDWEAGDEDDDNKASADVALSKTVGTLTIPVNMIVRQYNGLTRTVTFNKNTEDSNIQTPSSQTVTDGGTISNIPDLNSNDVVFIGWYTSPTGGAKLTSSTPIIDDITYYAHYGALKTVTFNTHGGSSVSPISVGEGRTLSSLPTSTKEGFELAGWFTLETGGTELTTSTVINSDITYHAQWTKSYNVGGLVYFDPTSSSTTCSNDDPSQNDSSCMSWRIISVDTSANTLTLQLDHNLVNNVAWVTKADYNDDANWQTVQYYEGNNNKGPITALKALATATSGWSNIDSAARMITRAEILALNNNSTTNLPSWLIENPGSGSPAYWTSTGSDSKAFYVYGVFSSGNVSTSSIDGNTAGVRPVITISKTKLK